MANRKINFSSLKRKYNNPVTAERQNGPGDYCVLGALNLELGGTERFPDRVVGINDAFHIYEANDNGNFALAWKLLREALDKAGMLAKPKPRKPRKIKMKTPAQLPDASLDAVIAATEQSPELMAEVVMSIAHRKH